MTRELDDRRIKRIDLILDCIKNGEEKYLPDLLPLIDIGIQREKRKGLDSVNNVVSIIRQDPQVKHIQIIPNYSKQDIVEKKDLELTYFNKKTKTSKAIWVQVKSSWKGKEKFLNSINPDSELALTYLTEHSIVLLNGNRNRPSKVIKNEFDKQVRKIIQFNKKC